MDKVLDSAIFALSLLSVVLFRISLRLAKLQNLIKAQLRRSDWGRIVLESVVPSMAFVTKRNTQCRKQRNASTCAIHLRRIRVGYG